MSVKEIEDQIKQLRQQAEAIKTKEFDEQARKLDAAIDKTFIYKNNSYSCPEPGQYWDEFRKVTGIKYNNGLAWIFYINVKIDYTGHAQVENGAYCVTTTAQIDAIFSGGWKPCKASQFRDAFEVTQSEILYPKKMAKFYAT